MGTGSSKRSRERKTRKRVHFKMNLLRKSSKKLTADVEAKKADLLTLKPLSDVISAAISLHDRQLVDDHVSSLEKKLASGAEVCIRQQKVYEVIIVSYDGLLQQCSEQLDWLQAQSVDSEPRLNEEQTRTALQEQSFSGLLTVFQTLLLSLAARQAASCQLPPDALLAALSAPERDRLQQRLRLVGTETERLRAAAERRCSELQALLSRRDALAADTLAAREWLAEKEGATAAMTCVPLAAVDVRRALDARKSLLSEVRAFSGHVERLLQEREKISLQDGDSGGAAGGDQSEDVDRTVTDIGERYHAMKSTLETAVDRCQEALVNHKQLEAELQKIDKWVKDVEAAAAKPLEHDSSLQLLDEQVKVQQTLVTESRVHGSLLADVAERADAYVAYLGVSDRAQLKERVQTAKENLQRAAALIGERLRSAEDVFSRKSRLATEADELSEMLQGAAEGLRGVQRGVGPRRQHATVAMETLRGIQDTLSDNQAKVSAMEQTMEQLRALGGQPAAMEQLSWSCQQYQNVLEQVEGERVKVAQSLALREQYESHVAELRSCLEQCRADIGAVDVPGVTVATKMARYQTVLDALHAKESLLATIEDEARRISAEGATEQSGELEAELSGVRAAMADIRGDAEQRRRHLQAVLCERENFETELVETTRYLCEMEPQLCSCREQLSMDVRSVEAGRSRLAELREEVSARVDATTQRVAGQTRDHDHVGLHLELLDKIDDFQTLAEAVRIQFVEEESKLVAASAQRIRFEETWKLVGDWLKTAEGLERTNNGCTNYETIERQLEINKEHLAAEHTTHERFDELLDLSETLGPTLDMNDRATLTESMTYLNARLVGASSAVSGRQRTLERRAAAWTQYQCKLTEVNDLMETAMIGLEESPDLAPHSIEQAREHIQQSQEELCTTTTQWQHCMSELTSATLELEQTADPTTATNLKSTLTDVRGQLHECRSRVEEKQAALQETVSHWETYLDQADCLQTTLSTASHQLAPDDIDCLSTAQLEQQLHTTQRLSGQMEEEGVRLIGLQKTCHTVLAQLPPCPAKAAIQDRLLLIQQQYQQLEWRVTEDEEAVSGEQAGRRELEGRIREEVGWLREATASVQQPPGGEERPLEALKSCGEALRERAASARRLLLEQRARSGGVPPELAGQLGALEAAERGAEQQLAETEQRVERAGAARRQYTACRGRMEAWLEGASRAAEHGAGSLQRHQVFVSEMASHQGDLADLDQLSVEVVALLPPGDRAAVTAAVETVRDRWLRLESRVAEEGAELEEASEVGRQFEEAQGKLADWAGKCERIGEEKGTGVGSGDSAREKLARTEVVLREADALTHQMAALDGLAEKLAAIGDGHRGATARDAADEVRHLVAARLAEARAAEAGLKGAVEQWEGVERERGEVESWADGARGAVQSGDGDANATSRQQLKVNQDLLCQLAEQESRMADIASRRRQLGGDDTRGSQLSVTLGQLRGQLTRQQSQLSRSVERTEAYEHEVTTLGEMIATAQRRLVAVAPPGDATAESLRLQLLEHKAIAAQIQTWQSRIDEINRSGEVISEHSQSKDASLVGDASLSEHSQSKDASVVGDASLSEHSQSKDASLVGDASLSEHSQSKDVSLVSDASLSERSQSKDVSLVGDASLSERSQSEDVEHDGEEKPADLTQHSSAILAEQSLSGSSIRARSEPISEQHQSKGLTHQMSSGAPAERSQSDDPIHEAWVPPAGMSADVSVDEIQTEAVSEISSLSDTLPVDSGVVTLSMSTSAEEGGKRNSPETEGGRRSSVAVSLQSDDTACLIADYTRLLAAGDGTSDAASETQSTNTLAAADAADDVSDLPLEGSTGPPEGSTEPPTGSEAEWTSSPQLSVWSEDTVGLLQGYEQSEGSAPSNLSEEVAALMTASVREALPEGSMTGEERVEMGDRKRGSAEGGKEGVCVAELRATSPAESSERAASLDPQQGSRVATPSGGRGKDDAERADTLSELPSPQRLDQSDVTVSTADTSAEGFSPVQQPGESSDGAGAERTPPACRSDGWTPDVGPSAAGTPNTGQSSRPATELSWPTDQEKPRTLSDMDSVSISLQSIGSEFVAVPRLAWDSDGASSGGARNRSRGATSVVELNRSWSGLLRKLQEREDGLKAALSRHDDYQADVKEANTQLICLQAQMTPSVTKVATTTEIQMQITQNKGLSTELKTLGSRLLSLQQRGAAGEPTQVTSLCVLQQQLDTLTTQAGQRAGQLQTAAETRRGHDADLKSYQHKVAQFQHWLTAASIQHASGQQLKANEALQEEVRGRVAQLAALGAECDRLAPLQPPATSHTLRLELTRLGGATAHLRAETHSRHDELGEGAREASGERGGKTGGKTGGLEEYQREVGDLQRWVEQTKGALKVAPPDAEVAAEAARQQEKLREKLESELSEHQDLLRAVAETARQVAPPGGSEAERSARDMASGWRELSLQLAEKQAQLRDALDAGRSETSPQYYRPYAVVGGHPERAGEAAAATLRASLCALTDCWRSLQGQVDDKQGRVEQTLRLQGLYQGALGDVSTWLDDIELRLLGAAGAGGAEEHLEDHESLRRELRTVDGELSAVGDASRLVIGDATADSQTDIRTAITSLGDRLKTLEGRAQQKEEGLQERNREWKLYQDEVRALQLSLSETRRRCSPPASGPDSIPLQQQLADSGEYERELQRYSTRLDELRERGERMREREPLLTLPLELSTLQRGWAELRGALERRRGELERAVGVQGQYERTLSEYAEYLETADSKLREDAIAATCLEHLNQQLTAHKEFFTALSTHRVLLDALAGRADGDTRRRYAAYHARLANLSEVLQDRAAARGQRLTRLAAEWREFRAQYDRCATWLDDVEATLPHADDGVTALEPLRHAVWTRHALQRALLAERPALCELAARGRQLLEAVACPALDEATAEFSGRWVALSNETAAKLKQLETLVDQWEQFERDAASLQSWMATADNQLQLLSTIDDLQDIGMLRSKMQHFLDLKKEVDQHQPIKTKVSTLGNQLLRSCAGTVGGSDLERRLAAVDEAWLLLMSRLPDNEERLHAAQMELLPSRQALHELGLWLHGVEQTLQRDNDDPLPASLIDIRVLVHKYKSLNVDLQHKQLTMDFVNQASAPAPPAAAADRQVAALQSGERTEFAERLGETNRRYESAAADALERLKAAEARELGWEEWERGCGAVGAWCAGQGAALDAAAAAGHEASVRQALTDSQVLEEDLMAKEDEIESLAKLGRSLLVLPSGEVSHSTNVSDTISRLNHDHSALSQQLEATRVRLAEVLRLWEAYQAALAAANQRLTEMDFSLSRCHSASGDLETFSAQIARLQTINAEFCQSQRQLDLLTNSAAELTEMCDEAVSKSLLHSVNQVKDGWHAALEAGEQRVWQFKEVTRAWQHYERETGAVRQWLTERDAEMGRLTSEADDALSREQQLHNAQTLRTRLDDSRDRLPLLGGLSAALIPHMDPTTAVRLTSAETALGQRLLQLQQGAAVLVGRCEAALQRAGSYDDTRGRVERLLADADAELERADPGSTAEADLIRARSAQLEALTLRFTDTQASLDSLNESGYRLALTAAESTALRRLNGRWHAALAAATERYKTQQARLLLQQDFSDKCREWMAFLGRVERDLAAEIVGNHDGLVAQQRAFDAFQSEMYARQQILAAIVSDGRRLLGDGAGTVDAAFQRKLSTLGAQWQSVVRRAAQRKAAIDGGVVRWREYRRRTDETDGRLAEMERGVAALEATGPASIERITAMLAAAKRILKLMQIFNIDESLLEVQKLLVGSSCVREASEHTVAGIGSVYQKVHELGNQLIATSDAPERARIEGSLGALHARWLALVASVEDRRTALEAVVRLWGDAEGGMEEALDWLKRVRGAVVTPMPDSYDGLQRELQQCEAFEETFEASAPKRDELAAQQRTLAASVGTEDSTILHQRLQLLGQQWDEILSQVELRKQGVLGRLQKWTTFNERQMELMGVLGAIEAKVNANSDLHIEDLLLKLNHEYKDEMTKVKVDCDAMAARGSELREGSSDVRASDIQHRVNELTTRWQQVQDTIANRTRKLSETLVAVQQLERNMSELRAWLARVERHLGSPVVYTECSRQQIEERLRDQQETQRDIERQSSGVASVLSLCEVLLRDADACPTANETAAIEQATESLQTRWHNICALSIQRKLRIEKSWRLWQKFNDQQQKLDDWLDEAEQKLQAVTSEEATFDTIKNEIRNVETIQSQVLDRLESLEQLNRLYRSLAREGRTDTGGGMKAAVTAVNQHWDDVAGRAAAVLRRRRHLAATFGDYTAEREAMLVWFAGVDEQLGALGRGRGCSALDARARAREVKALGEEMEAKEGHIEYVHRAATYLMQKCEEDDAVRIEAELSDFEQVCALIGAKLASNHSRLRTVSMGKDNEYELEIDDSELYSNGVESADIASTIVVRYKPRSAGHGRLKKSRKSPARASPDPSLTPVTPATLASIDWDLDGDDELDSEFPVEPPDVSSPDGLDEDEAERLESGRFQADLEWKWRLIKECIGADHQHQVELLLAGLERALADVSGQLAGVQRALRAPTAVGPHAQRLHHKYYETLVSSCEDGIDKLLTTESQLKSETGLTKIIGANTQIEGVLERWSTLQTEAQDKDSQLGQHRQQWAQFKVDLDNTLAWLDDADAIHSTQLDVPEDLRLLQVAARRHSDLQLQLDSRRPVVLSLNLVCREVAPPSREWRRVAARLDELNRRWDRVCARTAVWRGELHFALLHSAAFHDQLDRWRRLLAAAETELRRGEPVDVGAGEAALLVKYRRFREIHGDLSRSQVQILSLCEMALDLLSLPSSRSSPTMDSEDAAAARDRLNGLTTRLTTLLTTCVTHMSRIESAVGSGLPGPSVLYELDVASARLLTARSAGQPPRPLQRGMSAANSNDLDSERRDETGAVGTERGQRGRWARWGRWRRGGFLRRVLCTALPLQAFLLLLLGAACWLPLASREDQFSCVLANSLQHSLDPMLQYDNGPPPF